MKNIFIAFSIFIAGMLNFSIANAQEYFGEFIGGKVKAEWVEDNREMTLLADFSFKDPNGLIWTAKKGDIIDGASIPQMLWTFIGSPFSGKYRQASVIHDVACVEKLRTWEVVHLAFYYAMRTSGVNALKAKIMYAGVHHFGPRWSTRKQIVLVQEEKVITERVDVCKEQGRSCAFPIFRERIVQRIPARYEYIPVLPPISSIDKPGFEKLISEIEAREITDKKMSLTEITEFSNI